MQSTEAWLAHSVPHPSVPIEYHVVARNFMGKIKFGSLVVFHLNHQIEDLPKYLPLIIPIPYQTADYLPMHVLAMVTWDSTKS